MPIEKKYSYKELLSAVDDVAEITGEKPCIGIMLFNQFSPKGQTLNYTNSVENILNIINELNPEKCRLSFCEYNSTEELGKAEEYSKEQANLLIEEAKNKGFEAKIFSSFGQEKRAACGMLGGKEPEYGISDKWKKLNELANELILEFTK